MILASPWAGGTLGWFSRLYILSPLRDQAREGLVLSAVIVTPWASHGDITTSFSRPAWVHLGCSDVTVSGHTAT